MAFYIETLLWTKTCGQAVGQNIVFLFDLWDYGFGRLGATERHRSKRPTKKS